MAQNLDVLSISHALRFQRRSGAILPKDYGFTRFKADTHDNGVDSCNEDGSYYFGVQVLEDLKNRKLLCINEAATDHTFDATYPISVRQDTDGFFHQEAMPSVTPDVVKECYLHGITNTLAYPPKKK